MRKHLIALSVFIIANMYITLFCNGWSVFADAERIAYSLGQARMVLAVILTQYLGYFSFFHNGCLEKE